MARPSVPSVDNERVATILVEALYYGDTRTAQNWDCHKRTIQNYRARLKKDNDLVLLFEYKKKLFEADWVSDIPVTIKTAMDYIRRAAREMELTPEGLHSIAGALKIVAEVGITKEMIDVRLADLRHNREVEQEVRQVDTPRLLDG